MKEELKKDFKITDLGEINWILGFEVKRDCEKRLLLLLQVAYIQSVLEHYSFKNMKPYTALMDPNCQLSTKNCPKMAKEFAVMKDKPY